MSCAHTVTVEMPGCLDLRCMDCGEVILSTGEQQPGLFPAADRDAALGLARKQSRRKATRLLNLELFS